MGDQALTSTGFYALATSTAAAALLSHIPTDANGIPQCRAALVRAVGADCNVTLDGTTPTTTGGGGYPVLIADTGGLWIWGLANVMRLKVIAKTGTGTLNVLFFN